MIAGRPAWVEIDLSAIQHNVTMVKQLLSAETRLCAVVKADGYGHGAVPVAQKAVAAGADFLAVAILDEAVQLREAGFTQPILILGYTPEAQADMVVAHNLRQTTFTLSQAEALATAARTQGKQAILHLKVDSGMNRLGVPPQQAGEFAAVVAALPGIVVEGVFTHFATADSHDTTLANHQFALFTEALDRIHAKGIRIAIRHCANSAATVAMPQTHLDMVRVGIVLYGLWPSQEVLRPVRLLPAMRFKARVAMVKDIPAGVQVGYGGTFITTSPARIASLPLGYADGWPRNLGNRGHVFIQGKSVPIAGRVCMDQFMVDATGVAVKEGDEVLLFGGEELPVEDVAALAGTINYEIVCLIGKRVPRVYV